MNMYSSNPNLPRVRMQTVRLVPQGWSKRKVGWHLGFHHMAVSRWCARAPGQKHTIPTMSSRPKSSAKALNQTIISEIVRVGQEQEYHLSRE